ncbi:MAG: flippase-like domain-containing protein [Candidatus Scalindua sp.]|nr:flippase-like domain-containing protein [Candidatus Scalindua sp.]MCR4344530.1 flippase-like domain-containing protein [Candidatus Scalindua sp.]
MNKQKLKILLLVIGFSAFLVLVYVVGPAKIYQHFCILKWKMFLLLIPYTLVFVFDTLGWHYSFRERKISFKNLLTIRLAGETVNMIVPSAYFAGEPVKAYFLKRHNISMVDGMASVVISRTIMTIAEILFVILGVQFLILKLNLSSIQLIGSIGITLLGVPIIVFIIFIQKRGFFSIVLKILQKFGLNIQYLNEREHRLKELDQSIQQFYSEKPKSFIISFVFYFLGWIVGMAEVFLILYFLDIPIDILSAYIVESLSTVSRAITSFIPGSIGGQEGGLIGIFMILNLSASVALTFGILRRLRELIWIAAGLIVLSKLEWTMATPVPNE